MSDQTVRPSRLVMACMLAAAAAGTASAQTALTQTTGTAGQMLLGPGGKSVTDSSLGSNTATTIQQVEQAVLDRFDPRTGVLVGVRGDLRVDSATTLFVSGPPNGNYLGTGRTSATWTFQPGVSASAELATLQIDDDNTFAQTSTWASLAYNSPSAALGSFVGAGALQTSVTTTLLAAKSANSNSAEHRISTSTSDTLTAAISLRYSYLQHASAGFDSGGATSLSLAVSPEGADFSLYALGDPLHTTHLDLLGVSCVQGPCEQAVLDLSLQDLQAGQATAFHLTGATRSASYALLLGDDRQVGASNSQWSQTLNLTVTAVPEPTPLALLLAGLGCVGLVVRRRLAAPRAA